MPTSRVCPTHDDIENVVVLGMGGSGIAGDVLAAIAGPFMPVPVTVAKGYEAPSSVGEGTLCFAISFSGIPAPDGGGRGRARAGTASRLPALSAPPGVGLPPPLPNLRQPAIRLKRRSKR